MRHSNTHDIHILEDYSWRPVVVIQNHKTRQMSETNKRMDRRAYERTDGRTDEKKEWTLKYYYEEHTKNKNKIKIMKTNIL